jgi:membrane fusion protein (multidrug efflux system)
MKAKWITLGVLVLVGAGLGYYFLARSHREEPAKSDDEENVTTVVSVQVGALKRVTLHHYLEGYATVEPAPATPGRSAAGSSLASTVAGVVARADVFEGQLVKKGDVLIELNSGTMTVDYARQEAARLEKLYAQHNASLKSIQDAQAQLGALQVVAPLSGTVARLNARPGQAVDVNTVVAELVDLSRLVARAALPASEVGELNLGETVQFPEYPQLTAPISFVSPMVDTNSSTVAAWALLPADSGLRLGQFIRIQIVTAVHTNTLAAPAESVVTDLEGHSIISLVSGKEAVQTPVQTGFREEGWVEVAGPGLKEGDAVVTTGAYGLPKKTQISVQSAPADQASATNSSAAQPQ